MKKDIEISHYGRTVKTEEEKETYNQFIRRLISLVEETGNNPTAYQVSKDTGVSKATTKKWFGGAMPSANSLCLIASIYNCSVDYLLGVVDYRHYGNKEIMEVTGLTEQAVEVLRFASKMPDDDFDFVSKENKKILSCLNNLLQAGLIARRESESWPETSVLSLIYDYVYGSAGIKEKQNFNVTDNHGVQTEVKAKEIYKQLRLNQINNYLALLSDLNGRQRG